MSGGWVSGGPEWLFGLALDGMIAAFFALLGWVALQSNVHAPISNTRWTSGLLAAMGATLISAINSDGWELTLGPSVVMVALAGATYMTARAAYRQAGPAGDPVTWTQMVSPLRWSVPVVGLGGLVVATWSFAAMMLMGHSV